MKAVGTDDEVGVSRRRMIEGDENAVVVHFDAGDRILRISRRADLGRNLRCGGCQSQRSLVGGMCGSGCPQFGAVIGFGECPALDRGERRRWRGCH